MSQQKADIVSHIISKNVAKYEKYFKPLQRLYEKDLKAFDAGDLQEWGIINAKDRRDIFKIIQKKIAEDKIQPSVFQSALIRIICNIKQLQKYRDQLSKINDSTLYNLGVADLQSYGIKTQEDCEHIYAIIQIVIEANAALEKRSFHDILMPYRREMEQWISDRKADDFKGECAEEKCIHNPDRCCPLQRITIFLDVYNYLANEDSLWNKIPMSALIEIEDIYGHQQLVGDFLHVKVVHCKTPEMRNELLAQLNKHYRCTKGNDCEPFKRHYRGKHEEHGNDQQMFFHQYSDKYVSRSKAFRIVSEEDIVLQRGCDEIHSYFLHNDAFNSLTIHPPRLKERTPEPPELVVQNMELIAADTESKEMEQLDENCGGNKIDIDDAWFRLISVNRKQQSDEEIYKLLCEGMGIFHWQTSQYVYTNDSSDFDPCSLMYSVDLSLAKAEESCI